MYRITLDLGGEGADDGFIKLYNEEDPNWELGHEKEITISKPTGYFDLPNEARTWVTNTYKTYVSYIIPQSDFFAHKIYFLREKK